MVQWLQRHRRAVVALAMLAAAVRLVWDGLAFLGVLPPTGQPWVPNLLLLIALAALLPRNGRPTVASNWFARHRIGASVLLLALVLGAAWAGAAFERTWHTPLASRLIPDLLYLLAFGFWFRDFGQPAGLVSSSRTT